MHYLLVYAISSRTSFHIIRPFGSSLLSYYIQKVAQALTWDLIAFRFSNISLYSTSHTHTHSKYMNAMMKCISHLAAMLSFCSHLHIFCISLIQRNDDVDIARSTPKEVSVECHGYADDLNGAETHLPRLALGCTLGFLDALLCGAVSL